MDEVVAFTGERKRLGDGLPIPAEDEDAPDSLKKLRAIYHEQNKTLTAEFETAREKLLPAYTEKLKELESTLTKGGRISDALLVKAHREALGSEAAPMAPAPTVTGTPDGPVPAAPAPRPKVDDRKAAEWILANFKEHRIFADGKLVSTPAELPTNRFKLNSVAFDGGTNYTGAAPLDGKLLMENLGGLEGLAYFGPASHPDLKNEDIAVVATFQNLEKLKLTKLTAINDDFVDHLVGLRNLKSLEINECPGITGARFDIWQNPQVESLSFYRGKIDDSGIAALADFKKLRSLNVNGHYGITDASVPVIRLLPSVEKLYISATAITPEALATAPFPRVTSLACNRLSGRDLKDITPVIAPAFPALIEIQLTHEIRTPEDLAALAHFKKLRRVTTAGYVEEDAWLGLLELRDLEYFTHYLNEEPISDAALTALAQLKKLKQIDIGPAPPNPAALAAFKAARSDVKITTD